MNVVKELKSSIMAGICVGIAGFGYLAARDSGNGYYVAREIAGSILFSFALLAVVNYKLLLFTGTAGFITRNEGGLLAMGCGFIMTTAVTFARKGNNLPLLIGVPLFIICGFPHCIADAFYYMAAPLAYWQQNRAAIFIFYIAIALGNFVGVQLLPLGHGRQPGMRGAPLAHPFHFYERPRR